MIIGVCGFMESGKDTFADVAVKDFNFVKYSFAKPLKEGVASFFGWPLDKMNDPVWKRTIDPFFGVTPRQILQWFGTEVVRESLPESFPKLKSLLGSNFWIKRFEQWVDSQEKSVIIPDTRFQNEVDSVKSKGGIIIRIDNKSKIPTKFSHPSEDVASLTGIDYTLENNGSLDSFLEKSYLLLENLLNKEAQI